MVGTDGQLYLSPRQDSRAPSPRPHPHPTPTTHGLGGPLRRIVGASGERMRGVGPCGRPSGILHVSPYLKCIGPCGDPVWGTGNPSDVYTHLSI